jgi:endonuclease YncB( thermonuclease family)
VSSVPWSWPGSHVTRVIDGDSFTAQVTSVADIGFHGTTTTTFEQRMRLNRINASPAKTPDGALATAAFSDLVSGKTVLIVTTKPYKYGDEWMAEVTLPDGTNVSDAMVTGGHAVYWDGQGPRPGE